MKRKQFLALGGFQPFFFFIGMYFVALFFAILVCSSIFYAVNPRQDEAGKPQITKVIKNESGKKVFASVIN